jgi:hypothetical protein
MKDQKILKIIQIILASVSLAICIFLWGQINGFEQGYVSGVFQEYPHNSEIQFAAHGPNFYEEMNRWYAFIALGFLLFVWGGLVKRLVVSTVLYVLPFFFIILQYWQMIYWKNELLAREYKFPYEYWLQNSIRFDWFCLCAAVCLVIIQIILIINRRLQTETHNIN